MVDQITCPECEQPKFIAEGGCLMCLTCGWVVELDCWYGIQWLAQASYRQWLARQIKLARILKK